MNKHNDNIDQDYDRRTRGYQNIINHDPDYILQCIKESSYGDHNLLVYPSLQLFEKFYEESCIDSIFNRDETFVLATYYQDISYVRKKLKLAGIDTAKYEGNGTLMILDSQSAYRKTLASNKDNCDNSGIGAYNITMIAILLFRIVEKHEKNGVTIFGDVGKFILDKELNDLINYEQSVPSKLDVNIRPICCYHREDFEKIEEEQRNKIFRSHANNFIVS